MLLAGNWFWLSKKTWLFCLFFLPLFAKPFYVVEFLEKKNYQKVGAQKNPTSVMVFQKNDVKLNLQPFNRFYKVNQHTYSLTRATFYDENGLVLPKGDVDLFKKILDFYEARALVPAAQSEVSKSVEKSDIIEVKQNESTRNYQAATTENRIDYIFLDPGHGGKDPGAIFYGFKEKNLVLQLTLRLYEILKNKTDKINILLTREKDRYLSLESRTHLANSKLKEDNNGLFISTHLNIWLNPETRGLEVYYLGDDQEIFERRVQDIYLLENNIRNEEHSIDYFQKIFSFFKVIQFQNESRYLAEKIVGKTFIKVRGYPISRGVKEEIFYVLNGALMPAVLIELGFISNRQDLEFLLDETKSSQLLEAIALAIVDYVNEFNKSNGFSDDLFLFKLN